MTEDQGALDKKETEYQQLLLQLSHDEFSTTL